MKTKVLACLMAMLMLFSISALVTVNAENLHVTVSDTDPEPVSEPVVEPQPEPETFWGKIVSFLNSMIEFFTRMLDYAKNLFNK